MSPVCSAASASDAGNIAALVNRAYRPAPATGGWTHETEWIRGTRVPMITRHLRYVLNPSRLKEFEAYARLWLPLVRKFGGVHHGYLLPSEGASNIAMDSFSFPSLAIDENRQDSMADPDCQSAFKFAEDTPFFLSYERTLLRPVFE